MLRIEPKTIPFEGYLLKLIQTSSPKSYTNPPPPQENLLLQFLSYCTVPDPGCPHQPDFLMLMLRVKPFVSQGESSSCPVSVPWIIQFQCPATLCHCCAQLGPTKQQHMDLEQMTTRCFAAADRSESWPNWGTGTCRELRAGSQEPETKLK